MRPITCAAKYVSLWIPPAIWFRPISVCAVYTRYDARPDRKPPEFTPLCPTGSIFRSGRKRFRRPCVLRGRLAVRGARIRRHQGKEPQHNGAGPGVIRPIILLRLVIDTSGGAIHRRCVAGARVLAARLGAAWWGESPRHRLRARLGGVRRRIP